MVVIVMNDTRNDPNIKYIISFSRFISSIIPVFLYHVKKMVWPSYYSILIVTLNITQDSLHFKLVGLTGTRPSFLPIMSRRLIQRFKLQAN